jgi:hypothetical protein
MLVLGIAVAIALVLPLLTGGSYSRLVMTDWRWSGALFVGLGIQLALEFLPIPESRWDDLGFGLLLTSYALIIAFCARNVLLRGMAIVLIGVACNTLVIGLNHGMPVDLPPDLAKKDMFEPTVKHHPQDAEDRLTFLGDMIILRSPFDAALSFGDLIIAVGLCDVTYHASRRRKPRRDSDVHAAHGVALRGTNGAPPASVTAEANGNGTTIDLTAFAAASVAAPAAQPAVFVSPSERSSALKTRSS